MKVKSFLILTIFLGVESKMKNPHGEVVKEIMDAKIVMDDNETKKCVKIMKEVVEKICIEEMKQASILFKHLFEKIYWTGSYFDGLRVKKADEFDLNIILRFPAPFKGHWGLTTKKVTNGFVKITLDESPHQLFTQKTRFATMAEEYRRSFLDLGADGKFYFVTSKTRSWIQKVFDLAKPAIMDKLASMSEVEKISTRAAGPARNLILDLKNNERIDIDLVPAFRFKAEDIKVNSIIWNVVKDNGKDFFAIPKRSKADKKTSEEDREWRLDFHDFERDLLKDKGCSKPVIRLLKLYRDQVSPQLKGVSSYALKTVVMHMLKDKYVQEEWNQKNIHLIFIRALGKLMEYLKNGKIPYFFHHDCNILWEMKKERSVQIGTWLGKELKKLEATQVMTDKNEIRNVWLLSFKMNEE